jgi:hypothetical protein
MTESWSTLGTQTPIVSDQHHKMLTVLEMWTLIAIIVAA